MFEGSRQKSQAEGWEDAAREETNRIGRGERRPRTTFCGSPIVGPWGEGGPESSLAKTRETKLTLVE